MPRPISTSSKLPWEFLSLSRNCFVKKIKMKGFFAEYRKG
jgi:hypothetical protein